MNVAVEGKSKKFYELEELGDDRYFMVFKPHLRSVTYKREGNIVGTEHERLVANNFIMNYLERWGVPTHKVSKDIEVRNGEEGLVVKRTKTIPIEFICRYYAAGSIVRLYPSLVKEGMKFSEPLFKYDLKQDVSVAGVDDPTLNESYIVGLELLTQNQFNRAKSLLCVIGELMRSLLTNSDMKLIDMKMEFGFDSNGDIILIDEISQDCIRANDIKTDESLTKDTYRKWDTDEKVLEAYKNFNKRIMTNKRVIN